VGATSWSGCIKLIKWVERNFILVNVLRKIEYDFLTWTSFPSSIKLINDEPERAAWTKFYNAISVRPGFTLRVQIMAKQENVQYYVGGLAVEGFDGKEWTRILRTKLPLGTFDWSIHSQEITVPANVVAIRLNMAGGAGEPGRPGITWFDDLKIYQDNVLIYANDFSNWNPYIGAGAGGVVGGVGGYQLTKDIPTAVGVAALGALVGAAIGYLIPV